MSIAQLASKIDKIKVYAEGSTVRRLASLSAIVPWSNFVTENIEVEIGGLPLALDDASVRVRVDNGETGTDDRVIVVDVRVGLSVPSPVEVPISDLEALIQTAKIEVDRLNDLQSTIVLEMAALNVLNVPDRPIGEEGKAPPISPTGARVALANFQDEQKQLRIKEKRELDLQLRTATENLADLRQQQILASNANVAKEHELRKTIIARLQISDRQPASLPVLENLQLIVEYFVQGAKWTPTYVCRLNSVNNTAEIALRALICQRTGEDWAGVQIELSTATPTAWCELPELPALRLGRSQTFSSKKAWRNPPQGAEMLFEDYDLQMRIAHKAISTVADSSSVLIPTLQPLSTGSRSFLSQKIENLRSDSSNDLDRAEKLAARSRAAYLQESEITGSLWVEEDPELAELKSRLQANASINVPALERMEEKVMPSEARASQAAMSRAAPAPGSNLFARVSSINRAIFDPLQEIKNYRLMRLADPLNRSQRGKLSLPDVKTIYLESLKRAKITVNFDLAEVLQQALSLAVCQHTDSLTNAMMRRMAKTKTFDFAYVGTGRVDIPSDGQVHSVALLEENAEIDLRYIVVPREDTNVFRIAQLRNPLRSPLLAGSTDVYVDGEYILSTRIDTVPPKGQMELGLGVEQSIKVARNTSFEEVRSGESLVAFNELRHSIQISIANRLGRNARIEVRERIPVPQADVKVDVTVTQVAPAWEKYEQQERNAVIKGGYRWQINVPAGGETELTANYTIKTFVDNELVNGNRREE